MPDLPDMFARMTPEIRDKFRKHKRDMDTELPEEWRLTEDKKTLFLGAKEIAWDVETISDVPKGMDLEFAVEKFGTTFLSHVTHIGMYSEVDGVPAYAVLTAPFDEDEVEFLDTIFSDPDIVKIAQYSTFDTKMLCGKYPISNPSPLFDTRTASAVLRGSYGGDPRFFQKSDLNSLSILYGIDERWHEFLPSGVTYFLKRFNPETRLEEAKFRKADQQEKANLAAKHFFTYMKNNRGRLQELPPIDVAVYVMCDVWVTYWVYKAQLGIAHEMAENRGWPEVWQCLEEDMKVQEIENEWCIRGFYLDIPYMRWMLEFIRQRKIRLIAYFRSLGCGDMSKEAQQYRYIFHTCKCTPPKPLESRDGKTWWPAEMEHRLWTDAGLKAGRAGDIETVRQGGSKYWSTGSDALEWYAKQEPQGIGVLQYYNSLLATERSIKELLAHAQEDGRVHPGLSVTANTGRTNSAGPNMMNINNKKPVLLNLPDFTGVEEDDSRIKPLLADDENGAVYTVTCRGMIVAPPGYALLEFDASNAESRFQAVMAALMAGDLGLALVFAQGRDMHASNAAAYWPILWNRVSETCSCKGEKPYCTEHDRLRYNAKGPYFAQGYGAKIPKLSSQLMTPMDVVKEMMDNYDAAYPGISLSKDILSADILESRNVMRGIVPRAHYSAFVTLWNGRRVWIETLPDGTTKAYTGWNALQQGGVAGIVNRSVIELDRWLKEQREKRGFRSFIYQQEHDAIIVAVPIDNIPEMFEVGEYTAKLLMTQLPYDFTVINSVHVPWPSGCNLDENSKKWNWRWNPKAPSYLKGKPSPFPTKDGEGLDIEISYPEEAAWIDMVKKAKRDRVEKLNQDIVARDNLLHNAPKDYGFTVNIDGKIERCPWGDVVSDLPSAFEAARLMARKLEKGEYVPKQKKIADLFVQHMVDLASIVDSIEAFTSDMARYDDALAHWESVAEARYGDA